MAKTIAQIVGKSTAPKMCGRCQRLFYHPDHDLCHACYEPIQRQIDAQNRPPVSMPISGWFALGTILVSTISFNFDPFFGLCILLSIVLGLYCFVFLRDAK